jgi:hypothetical protein
LTEVDSPFIFIDKETLSFRSEGISYIDIIKLIYCFVLVAPMARQRCSITKTGKWFKLLTLPLPISKCLQVSTMFASLTAGLIKNVCRTWGPALPTLLSDLMIFCPLGPMNFKNSVYATKYLNKMQKK